MQGLNVTVSVIAFGISDVTATIVLLVLLQKYFPVSQLREGEMREVAPEVFRFAVPLWLSGMLRQFRRSFQTILLGATAAAASVGIYSIVSSITTVGHVCLLALFVAVKPTLARLHDIGDREGLTHLYTTATRWAYTITLPFFLVIVLFRESILLVFGESFAAGSTALLIYAFAEVVNAGTGICGPVLDMTGHTMMKLVNAITLTVLLVGRQRPADPALRSRRCRDRVTRRHRCLERHVLGRDLVARATAPLRLGHVEADGRRARRARGRPRDPARAPAGRTSRRRRRPKGWSWG